MLNAKLAATESMTHDVIRDMLTVKMNMTTCAVGLIPTLLVCTIILPCASKPPMPILQALVDNQQKMETKESIVSQAHEPKEVSFTFNFSATYCPFGIYS
jgi:kinesin family member 15